MLEVLAEAVCKGLLVGSTIASDRGIFLSKTSHVLYALPPCATRLRNVLGRKRNSTTRELPTTLGFDRKSVMRSSCRGSVPVNRSFSALTGSTFSKILLLGRRLDFSCQPYAKPSLDATLRTTCKNDPKVANTRKGSYPFVNGMLCSEFPFHRTTVCG